ncbi:hypothetical protein NDU88_008759 [Pleurodeles waltl]|uniref:Uncharacterized protein n=1 Tax=Pleurodeles waltl TaxID=8319 RepID=A0AAV7RXT7_PLEWA|nr:hypothetical protein NDU88_008759 [Pleurodeles waltl]
MRWPHAGVRTGTAGPQTVSWRLHRRTIRCLSTLRAASSTQTSNTHPAQMEANYTSNTQENRQCTLAPRDLSTSHRPLPSAADGLPPADTVRGSASGVQGSGDAGAACASVVPINFQVETTTLSRIKQALRSGAALCPGATKPLHRVDSALSPSRCA